MRRVIIQDNSGKDIDAFVPESKEDLESQIKNDRKQNLKEHLYMGYLMIGTLAFLLGIVISLKRLNGGK